MKCTCSSRAPPTACRVSEEGQQAHGAQEGGYNERERLGLTT